ncbi:MAG TPA: DHA2 family efflux MFS transporter permease subunit [Caulobacteraceae bacterium]|jgi:EmrB/QacA subfamily drug resistance transporter
MSRMSTVEPKPVDQVARGETPPAVPVGRLTPIIIGSALFMQTLDSTVITNALPTMARSLHEDPLTLNLAITSYLLASAVFLPISSWVADRFGAKLVFRIAIALFAIASLLCGLSRTLPELVGARMLQGMAGAMMTPVGRLVLLRSTPKNELVRAMSYLTMPAMLGPVIGPPIGGFIVTHWSWRWIFLINIPMGILGVVLVSLFIADIKEEHTPPLDWRGFILTGFGFAGLVYGFDNLGRGALPVTVVAAMIAGGAICVALFAFHARRTPHAILDLSLLKVRTFTTSVVGGAFLRMAMGASPFLLALLLQLGFGLNAFAAGLITFTSAAAALAMKTTARPIISRLGFKTVLVANTFIVALTFMSYALFRASTPYLIMVAALLVGGFFRSLQFTALNTLAFADIDQPRMSRASSLSSMGQQLSQSLGIGLAALLLASIRNLHHSPHLQAADVSPTFVVVGGVTLLGLFFFIPLSPDAGAEVSGRRVRASRAPPNIEAHPEPAE